MEPNQQRELLGDILRDVSRTFYWTLWVLPGPIRTQIGLAYLLARAADSIADTEALPSAKRMEYLLKFRTALQQNDSKWILETLLKERSLDSLRLNSGQAARDDKAGGSVLEAEKKLLTKLPQCFELFASFSNEDRSRVLHVVEELTLGMEQDLKRFPDRNQLKALQVFQETEDYAYQVAGCVGPFWTKMCIAHIPSFKSWDEKKMCELGIRFGKALQWTNILRDIPQDLANGRCYLPLEDLQKIGITPEDLLKPGVYSKLKPLYHRYLDHLLEHYKAAWEYTSMIPRSQWKVRLACIWPIWIGLETIALLRSAENPLQKTPRIRITRGQVYGIGLRSIGMLGLKSFLDSHTQKLMKSAR